MELFNELSMIQKLYTFPILHRLDEELEVSTSKLLMSQFSNLSEQKQNKFLNKMKYLMLKDYSLSNHQMGTLIYNYGILEESDIFMFQIASQYGNIHACSILMEDLIFENEYNEAHKYELIIAENGTTWDQFQLASKLQRGIALNSKTQLKKALYWYKKCLTMQHDEFEESLLNLKDYRVQAMFSIRHLKLLCPFIIS
jgi:hypothetical protein